jgi:hypothetical protein
VGKRQLSSSPSHPPEIKNVRGPLPWGEIHAGLAEPGSRLVARAAVRQKSFPSSLFPGIS